MAERMLPAEPRGEWAEVVYAWVDGVLKQDAVLPIESRHVVGLVGTELVICRADGRDLRLETAGSTPKAVRLETAAINTAFEYVQRDYSSWLHQSGTTASSRDIEPQSISSVLLWALRTAEQWGAAVQRTPADLALASLIVAIESQDKQQAEQHFEQAEKTLLVQEIPLRTRLVWSVVFGCAALFTGRRCGIQTYLDALAELAAVDAGCVVDRTVMPHLGPAAQQRWNAVTLPGLRAEAARQARQTWQEQIAARAAALAQGGQANG
jgi:hypothetical protein